MDERFRDIKAVGFDLDQTLYPDSQDIRQAVRGEFYRLIAEKNSVPVEKAQEMFESAYAELRSSSPSFARCGITNASEAVRDCLDRANVAALLKRDLRLVDMMNRLQAQYRLFLITDSRVENAYAKLRAIGINQDVFCLRIMWDYDALDPGKYKKDNGSAFGFVQHRLGMQPHELVYVGDREIDDIAPAAQLGWKTVHVSNRPSSKATAGIKDIYGLEGLLL